MPDILRQFIIFCGVGSINTAAGLAVILLLSEVFGVNYILANALGYGFGLLIGFFLHRSITFRNQCDDLNKQVEFIKFVLVFAVAYGVQLLGLIIMVQFIGLPSWLAQIPAVGIYTAINYLGNRVITFRNNAIKTEEQT